MATKFDFASPGIKINEIDATELPAIALQKGPILIGRFEKGPDNVPTVVQSMAQLRETFGGAITGETGDTSYDAWRIGNRTSPQYAAIAAYVALANNIPVTVIRVVGMQSSNQTTGTQAGYNLTDYNRTTATFQGAMGLFVVNSASLDDVVGTSGTAATGSLAAVFYLDSGSIELKGTDPTGVASQTGSCTFLKSTNTTGKPEFNLLIKDGAGTLIEETKITFNNNPASDTVKYIRDLNTNPVLTNTTLHPTSTDTYKSYWLGETYESDVPTGVCWGVTLPLKGDYLLCGFGG